MSRFLADRVRRDYGLAVTVIPNGIGDLPKPQSDSILQDFGLTPGRYLLTVARIDPQKCQLDLIEAYRRAQPAGWKLALAGGADYASDYSRAVARAAQETPGVVMLGHQKQAALAELYTNAGAFVLPSSHEGQPIAVIEALGYGCPVLLSDIPAHRELGITAGQYFEVGNIGELADAADSDDRQSAGPEPAAYGSRPYPAAARLALDRAAYARRLPRRALPSGAGCLARFEPRPRTADRLIVGIT